MREMMLAAQTVPIPPFFENLEKGKSPSEKRKIRKLWMEKVPHERGYSNALSIFGAILRKEGIKVPRTGVPKKMLPPAKVKPGELWGMKRVKGELMPTVPGARNIVMQAKGEERKKLKEIWKAVVGKMKTKNYRQATTNYYRALIKEGYADYVPETFGQAPEGLVHKYPTGKKKKKTKKTTVRKTKVKKPAKKKVRKVKLEEKETTAKPKKMSKSKLRSGVKVLVQNTVSRKYNGKVGVVDKVRPDSVVVEFSNGDRKAFRLKNLYTPRTRNASADALCGQMIRVARLVEGGKKKGRGKKKVRGKKLKPVRTLGELYMKARSDPQYEKLAIEAAKNLGGNIRNLRDAKEWLDTNAMETDEEGTVDEVNYIIDFLDEL